MWSSGDKVLMYFDAPKQLCSASLFIGCMYWFSGMQCEKEGDKTIAGVNEQVKRSGVVKKEREKEKERGGKKKERQRWILRFSSFCIFMLWF